MVCTVDNLVAYFTHFELEPAPLTHVIIPLVALSLVCKVDVVHVIV